ncbi:MAG: zinc ribbon domain-containing protein [Chloroflexota bacterium]|nr:zinc ribbon domain-containing protein [Chloroflexota bacterium]
MPRYDYQCKSCGNEFELRQSFSEAGSGTCPECSGEGRRVFHAVPVIYKGSGFYTTDYGRPKAPADEKPKETASSKESSSSDTKSEKGTESSTTSTTSTTDTKSDSSSKATSDSNT